MQRHRDTHARLLGWTDHTRGHRQTEDKGYNHMQETQAGSGDGKTDRWGGRQGAEQVSREDRQASRQAAEIPEHERVPQAEGPSTLSGYEVV